MQSTRRALGRAATVAAVVLAAMLLALCLQPTKAHAESGTYGFSDVIAGDWYANDEVLGYALDHGLVKGYSGSNNFGPYDNITRGQVAVVLHRMSKEPAADAAAFEDVNYSEYYGPAITWARSTGVINGYKDADGTYRTFKPDAPVTREELAAMLGNYAAKVGNVVLDTNCALLDAMPDVAVVSDWARTSVGWAMDAGLMSGDKSTGIALVNPQGVAWRCAIAKMASVLHRDVLPPTDVPVDPDKPVTPASDFVYEIRDGDQGYGVYITDYKGSSTEVVMPKQIEDVDVISAYLIRNQLTSLDVTRCLNLKVLLCFSSQLTSGQLTSLDVSGCPNLEFLNCRNNQLTSLDVSGCTNLEDIYCDNNQLTSLDMSGCTNLDGINCDSNQLTSLDVRACPKLRNLYCNNNQLTSLDVSKCPNLDGIFCNNNQLTSLDVSKCPNLKHFSCDSNQLTSLDVRACPNLEGISCDSNQLTSLDVSMCPKLESISCDSNQLTSLDVSKCPNLKHFSCDSNQLTSLDVRACPNLEHFRCSNNQLTSLDVSGCISLREFRCNNNQLTSLDVSGCTEMEWLSCDHNNITDLSALEAWLAGHKGQVNPQNDNAVF